MKEKLKNKKIVYMIIGIVSVLLVALAVTYAYWTFTKSQTNPNAVGAACLDIEITNEGSSIQIANQFPITDEAGLESSPYTFTVKNNCNTSIDYQVALEAIGTEAASLKTSSMKVALNDTVTLLSDNAEVDPTVEGAYESRKLAIETLDAKGTAVYELRLWIDKDAPVSENNKTFRSKISVSAGERIKKPIISAEGTLADAILSSYGGAEAIGEIDATWTEGTYGSETYKSMTASTSYYWGTEMNFDSSTGNYVLSGTVVQATVSECRNGQKSDGTAISCLYTLGSTTDAAYESNTGYKVIALTSSSKSDTSSTLYITAQSATGSSNFSKATTANEAGLYKAQDDLGDSYYFRGAPSNNYVQFGSYAANSEVNGTTYAEETPMYWRIVRINGDGSVRLIYDGIEKVANGVAHTATIVNTSYNTNNAAKYVGYTYDDGTGTQVDSTIKGVVDAWYDKHLEINYGTHIADSIFCNDRQVTGGSEEYPDFAPKGRLSTNKVPSLKCTNKSDRYTVNDITNGNGLLSNPVGVITADEVMFGGGTSSSNNTYYLFNGEYYWTSTPYYASNPFTFVALVSGNGYLSLMGNGLLYSAPGARPVINLKADVQFTGNGTIDNPYKIVTK